MIGTHLPSHRRNKSYMLGHETAKFSRMDERSVPPMFESGKKNRHYANPSLSSVLFQDRNNQDMYSTSNNRAFERNEQNATSSNQKRRFDGDHCTSLVLKEKRTEASFARYKKKKNSNKLDGGAYDTEYKGMTGQQTPIRSEQTGQHTPNRSEKPEQGGKTPVNEIVLIRDDPRPDEKTINKKSRQESNNVQREIYKDSYLVETSTNKKNVQRESRTPVKNDVREVQILDKNQKGSPYRNKNRDHGYEDERPANDVSARERPDYKSTIYHPKHKLDVFGNSQFSPNKEKVVQTDENISRHYGLNEKSPYRNTYGHKRPVLENDNVALYGNVEGYHDNLNQNLKNEEEDYLVDLTYQKKQANENYRGMQDRIKGISDTNVALHNTRAANSEYQLHHGNAPLECQKLDREYDEDIKDKKARYLDYLKHQAELDLLKKKICVQQEQDIERSHTGLVSKLGTNDYGRKNERQENLMKQYQNKEQILLDIKETNYKPDGNYQIHMENYYEKHMAKQTQRKKRPYGNPEYNTYLRSSIADNQRNKMDDFHHEKANDARLVNEQVEWAQNCVQAEKQRKVDQKRELNDVQKGQMESKNVKRNNYLVDIDADNNNYTSKYIDRFIPHNYDQRRDIENQQMKKARQQQDERQQDRSMMAGIVEHDKYMMKDAIQRDKSAKKLTNDYLKVQMQNKTSRILY